MIRYEVCVMRYALCGMLRAWSFDITLHSANISRHSAVKSNERSEFSAVKYPGQPSWTKRNSIGLSAKNLCALCGYKGRRYRAIIQMNSFFHSIGNSIIFNFVKRINLNL